MSTKIQGFINKYQGVVDNGLLWELVKMEIRAYNINFSKQRAKQQKNVEAELVKNTQNLKRKLAKKETQELLAEHIIRELESISLQRTRGACLRSKARWFEWGELSSKYLLSLEKRNYQNKHIQ